MPEPLRELLKNYPRFTGIIRFRYAGKVYDWAIGAHPKRDNEATLRTHLAKWRPAAEFIECAIKGQRGRSKPPRKEGAAP